MNETRFFQRFLVSSRTIQSHAPCQDWGLTACHDTHPIPLHIRHDGELDSRELSTQLQLRKTS